MFLSVSRQVRKASLEPCPAKAAATAAGASRLCALKSLSSKQSISALTVPGRDGTTKAMAEPNASRQASIPARTRPAACITLARLEQAVGASRLGQTDAQALAQVIDAGRQIVVDSAGAVAG